MMTYIKLLNQPIPNMRFNRNVHLVMQTIVCSLVWGYGTWLALDAGLPKSLAWMIPAFDLTIYLILQSIARPGSLLYATTRINNYTLFAHGVGFGFFVGVCYSFNNFG